MRVRLLPVGLVVGTLVFAASAQAVTTRPAPKPTVSTTKAGRPTKASPTKTAPATTKSATVTNTATSHLKGIASAKYIWHDPAKLTALHVSWAYGWSPWVPASTPALESVPMIARAADATGMVARSLARSAKAGAYTSLLGFNEPDHANQANMTPEQAIALWPLLESTGLRLGSPAPAVADDGWLDQFMTLAAQHHYRVDFIALHFYVDFTNPTAVASIMSTVNRVYAKYHKPVWITEIGAIDIRNFGLTMQSAPDVARATAFMTAATSAFAADPSQIERYAWFSDNRATSAQDRTSSLYDANDTLTPLGRAFAAVH